MAALPPIVPPDTQLPPYETIERKRAIQTLPISMDLDIGSPDSRNVHTPSAFSEDDIEVAKALTGLRECEFMTSLTIGHD